MSIDAHIAALVPGLSFVDIGGLWGTTNEKVTVALRAGAARAVMLDAIGAEDASWQALARRAVERGVSGYGSVVADLDDLHLPARIGRFDVVHCSGVIYHCPNPVHSLQQMARLTRRHLLIGTMTVPERIENAAGVLDFSGGQVVAVPALRGPARAVMRRHFEDLDFTVHNITSAERFPWVQAGQPNYAPWWWLWTAATLAAMVEALGMRVTEILDVWSGNAHYLLCEVPDPAG